MCICDKQNLYPNYDTSDCCIQTIQILLKNNKLFKQIFFENKIQFYA